jgi:hypothetical protein
MERSRILSAITALAGCLAIGACAGTGSNEAMVAAESSPAAPTQTTVDTAFKECPEQVQAALNELARELGNDQIALIVSFGDTQSVPFRCVTSNLVAERCNNLVDEGQSGSCGAQIRESVAHFSMMATNDKICWQPVGGTGGCDKITFP